MVVLDCFFAGDSGDNAFSSAAVSGEIVEAYVSCENAHVCFHEGAVQQDFCAEFAGCSYVDKVFGFGIVVGSFYAVRYCFA